MKQKSLTKQLTTIAYFAITITTVLMRHFTLFFLFDHAISSRRPVVAEAVGEEIDAHGDRSRRSIDFAVVIRDILGGGSGCFGHAAGWIAPHHGCYLFVELTIHDEYPHELV